MTSSSPFQWIIDTSQRQPQWWCMRCAELMLVCSILWFLLKEGITGEDAFDGALLLIVALFVNMLSQSAAMVARLGKIPQGLVLLLWLLALMSLLYIDSAAMLADRVYALAWASFYSFAACKPPAPPKHKPRLATQGGGA